MKRILLSAAVLFTAGSSAFAQHVAPAQPAGGDAQARADAAIGVTEDRRSGKYPHTEHPDAQWYPDAALGLFIHWGIMSVHASKHLVADDPRPRTGGVKRITDPVERARIIRESDYNLTGHPNSVTPDEYWSAAPQFNPTAYDPDKWIAAAKAAGFTYVVLTTRHHEGFALWPSASGGFNTSNWMGGRTTC